MGAVWECELPQVQRTVLLALADHADDFGCNARPSIAYLAWKTDYSRSSVLSALQELKRKGAVHATANAAGGRGKVACYRIDLSPLRKKRPFRGDPWQPRKGPESGPFTEGKGSSGQHPLPHERVQPRPLKGPIFEAGKEEPSDPSGKTKNTSRPAEGGSGRRDPGATPAEPADDPFRDPLPDAADARWVLRQWQAVCERPNRADRREAEAMAREFGAAVVRYGILRSLCLATQRPRRLAYCRGAMEETVAASLPGDALAAATSSVLRAWRRGRTREKLGPGMPLPVPQPP